MPAPTHVFIDEAIHKIALIEEHSDGPGHTHRVHLGCGMTIDVDIGGVKAHARSMERLKHIENEQDKQLKAIHVEHHTKAAAEALKNGETWEASRWRNAAKAEKCDDCEAHENGAPAKINVCNHSLPTTREADIDTTVACPKCGSKVYKRRKPAKGELDFACTGQGHEFTGPDLMDGIRLSIDTLTNVMKG